jgi:hypothetical protein
MIDLHLRRNGNSHNTTAPANGDGNVPAVDPEVTIRLLSEADHDALRVLAQRDTARALNGAVLGAERAGRLLAAISSSGDVIADPFHRTEDLVSLLRVRAGQLLPPPG